MKANEVKELTTADLQDRLVAEIARLEQLRLQHAISPLDNPLQIRESRRLVARIKTELRKRELTK